MLLSLAACGDGGPDAADAGREAGTGRDAGEEDAGFADSGAADGGALDGGPEAGGGREDGGMAQCEPPSLPPLAAIDVAGQARFDDPLYVTQAPGDDATLYVVERAGGIRLVRDGAILAEPFLSIPGRVASSYVERGLLGLAFHPDYASNGRFFIYYTPAGEMKNVLAEYGRSTGNPDRANRTEVRRLLEPNDPEDNHNGGMITFGPDGRLYVGMGDGGGRCDGHGDIGNAQDLDSPFGKIHRLDVDAAAAGFAAAGNPFVDTDGLDTVWAYGLRNPWRFAFDRDTGDLYIADVGQNRIEEVDFQPATSTGGENYGWRDFEGDESSSRSGCTPTGAVADHAEPILSVGQDSTTEVVRNSCSITGGYVYRGEAIPELEGVYLYGDHCSDDIGAFRYCDGRVVGHQRVADLGGVGDGLASFGQDHAGELYLVYLGSGHVKKVVPR